MTTTLQTDRIKRLDIIVGHTYRAGDTVHIGDVVVAAALVVQQRFVQGALQ